MAIVLGIICAVLLHAAVLAFGGILFLDDETDHGTIQQVELLSAEELEQEAEKPEEPEEQPEATEEMETADEEPPPDAAELMRSLDLSPMANTPELEAASLSAIEAALSGQLGGGDFSQALSFESGGALSGKGKRGEIGGVLEDAFDLTQIDQQPRALFQANPIYPASMRGKKVEGVVTLIFIVDETGKVQGAKVATSTHEAFEKPALDAVKKWKFEPAIKGGKRVACKMRAPIRFEKS